MDLVLNNLQRLICHKTNKPNQTIHPGFELWLQIPFPKMISGNSLHSFIYKKMTALKKHLFKTNFLKHSTWYTLTYRNDI